MNAYIKDKVRLSSTVVMLTILIHCLCTHDSIWLYFFAKSIARVITYELNYIEYFQSFTKQINLLEARYSSVES